MTRSPRPTPPLASRPCSGGRAPTARRQPGGRRPARGGFSFVEVLFAVMILGIGFIMIVGVFPVAINQAQATADDSIGAAVARGGAQYLASLPATANATPPTVAGFTPPPPNAPLLPVTAGEWQRLVGMNLILPEDPRYGWTAFCRRNFQHVNGEHVPANTAQVVVLALRVRNKGAYGAADLNANAGTLVPKQSTEVTFVRVTGDEPDRVTVNGAGSRAIAPGTFLVMMDTVNTLQRPDRPPPVNITGWVLRVGNILNRTNASVEAQLLSGNDLKSITGDFQADQRYAAYFVGEGPTAPGSDQYEGGAQDVAAYTGIIPLN